MLTKKEIMSAFSAIGCDVEDRKIEENWFFFTKNDIHYEVQIDVKWNNPDTKYLAILCPVMEMVNEKKYGYILEHAVKMLQDDLKERGIDQYQVNYDPDECCADSCAIMSYSNRTYEQLCNALESFFIFDTNVNETIQKNVIAGVNAMEAESDANASLPSER